MNTICQDRGITDNTLDFAHSTSKQHTQAVIRSALERIRTAPFDFSSVGMSTQEQVGKNRGVSWQNFANWIQLANRCQLKSLPDQELVEFSIQLAVGSRQILPTELSHCFDSIFITSEVGEISPSYYVGEGAYALSPLRREIARTDDPASSSRTVVLAIDLGTTTGWAMRAIDGHITHGFVSFKPGRYEGGGMRYLRFKRWLNELRMLASDIHSVYFEEVRRHAGVDAAHVYGGLLATLSAWCEHHNLPYQGVPVGTIKRHATGKGNANKDEVIKAMQLLGHSVKDDNEADALALLHWALDAQEG